MKNKLKSILFILFLFFVLSINAQSSEQFNFNITEVEITEEGNNYKGLKRGTISTDNGIIIDADVFNYNKISNKLNAEGNIKITDTINNYLIYTDKITYLKNDEIIFTEGNSKAINNDVNIIAENFNYDKNLNILKATQDVKFEDKLQGFIIYANDVTYKKNSEVIFTDGETTADVQNKYKFISSDVSLNRNEMKLSSSNKTKVKDNHLNIYELDEFIFYKSDKLLKGKNVKIITNRNLDKKDQDIYFFKDGFFDLENQNFTASKTKIKMHKEIFGNEDNDPRLLGVSSNKKNEITQINKGIFTSCKKRKDKCPPWSMQAEKIIHDKNKKQLIYDHSILKIYDKPVLYFPKFFHPDPSVNRQSGLLQPHLNDSDILGSSLQIPYFYVVSEDKDFTFTPNIFDSNIFMLQTEYRQKTENTSLIADFGHTSGYKSTLSQKKNSISHLFGKFTADLKLQKFNLSEFKMQVQKVTNDTYLKIFDGNLMNSSLKPSNKSTMTSNMSIDLNHNKFDFSANITSYEDLSGKNSDRYQYILPSYDFSKNLFPNFNLGTINFTSSGSNNLKNTNNLRSRVTNNIKISSFDNFTNYGLKNNFNLYFKNLNTVGKNDANYKNSPQVELSTIFEAKTSYPLIKNTNEYNEYIIPKISLRINPSDMKNYSDSSRALNVDNIFDINRLGLSDTFETGKSITLGIDYKKEKIENINRYFEIKLGTVFRDSFEKDIPNRSTINRKNSNLFGSIKNNINDVLEFNYQYAIDNNFDILEYNSLNARLNLNKFSTSVQFVEENGNTGDTNSIENTFAYTFDENNFLKFSTRRNRKINLTEYYDLMYEYKNDCLIAGMKYKKSYYQDRDLKPTEDLLLTLTIFPLTTYEKKFDRNN